MGVGKPHGDPPGVWSSSAKSEDCDLGAGLGSSSKSVSRDLAFAAGDADSSGDVPNSDIVSTLYPQPLVSSMKTGGALGHNRPVDRVVILDSLAGYQWST